MARVYYDADKLKSAYSKLPQPDGKHCIICGDVLPKFKRKYCSHECWLDWYNKLAINSWSDLRELVLKRDNYTCQKCGVTKQQLDDKAMMIINQDRYPDDPHNYGLYAHHINPICKGGKEFDIANCITLCHSCHMKAHKLLRTKSYQLSKWCKPSN